VTVVFELAPGAYEAFRAGILENAARSLEEPGCRRFDVCFSEDRTRCFLYELYDDEPAFAYHKTTPHFRRFSEIAEPLLKSKTLDLFWLSENPGARAPRA
jgi:quinol monooxygenase YgiN